MKHKFSTCMGYRFSGPRAWHSSTDQIHFHWVSLSSKKTCTINMEFSSQKLDVELIKRNWKVLMAMEPYSKLIFRWAKLIIANYIESLWKWSSFYPLHGLHTHAHAHSHLHEFKGKLIFVFVQVSLILCFVCHRFIPVCFSHAIHFWKNDSPLFREPKIYDFFSLIRWSFIELTIITF